MRDLNDLSRAGLRFINRQSGSGTRVWLDAALHRFGVDTRRISGYQDEKMTHSAVAQAVLMVGHAAEQAVQVAPVQPGERAMAEPAVRVEPAVPAAGREVDNDPGCFG